MSNPDDPRDEELSALYRSAAGESPTAGLDARILAAARAAATPPRKAVPASRPVSWTQRWRIPVALAATVLMTATLTLLVREHEVDGVPPPAPRREGAEAIKDAAPPAPAPAMAAPTPTRAPERRAAPPARDAAIEAGAPAERLADQQPPVSAKRAGPPAAQSAIAPPSVAPPAALSAPAAARADQGDRAEKSSQAERPARRGELELTPEQWLAEIRRLRSEGRTTEAAERLAAFKRRYPQFPLPEDMRAP